MDSNGSGRWRFLKQAAALAGVAAGAGAGAGWAAKGEPAELMGRGGFETPRIVQEAQAMETGNCGTKFMTRDAPFSRAHRIAAQ